MFYSSIAGFVVFYDMKVCLVFLHTLYIPSYRFPSSGQYLLCLRPLQLRTTLTGLPCFQFLDSAPFLSLTGTLQLRANALVRTKTNNLNMQNKRLSKTQKSFWFKAITMCCLLECHTGSCGSVSGHMTVQQFSYSQTNLALQSQCKWTHYHHPIMQEILSITYKTGWPQNVLESHLFHMKMR